MFRKLLIPVLATVLAAPLVARAQHDDDSDWGWIDDGDRVEEYDFAPGESVSIQTFQDGLSPYGQWVTVSSYGRVWRPAGIAVGWRPYYYGSWQWTDEGWLWASDEPWGWATYHYGRWAYDSFYGWVWVPGYQWAPAWVSWRFGGDYIGWAPLAPGLSVYVTNYPVVYDRWCFVPSARFVGYPVNRIAYVGSARVAPIFARTQPAPPRARVHGAVAPAWGGPARPFVEQRVGRPIAPVRVQAVATPRAATAAPRDGVIQVYRPEAARPRPAPARNGTGAPPRGGAVTAPGRPVEQGPAAAPSRPGNAPGHWGAPGQSGNAPSRPGGSAPSHAAPVRPGPAQRGGQPVQSAPPPAPPSAPAPAPARPRPSRVEQRSEGGDAAPVAPATPSYGGGGGGPSRGGGGMPAGGGGGGNRGGGHAVPHRR